MTTLSETTLSELIARNDEYELNEAVDAFAAAMRAKLLAKHVEGYRGWDDAANEDTIRTSLAVHYQRLLRGEEQEVDCANLLMMLWHFRITREALPAVKAAAKEVLDALPPARPLREDE